MHVLQIAHSIDATTFVNPCNLLAVQSYLSLSITSVCAHKLTKLFLYPRLIDTLIRY